MSLLASALSPIEFEQPIQVERNAQMTARVSGPNDKLFFDVSNPIFQVLPSPPQPKAGLQYKQWIDIEHTRNTTVDFGKKVQFQFGHQGPHMITKVEVHFELSAVVGTLTGSRTFMWAPFIAEKLLCGVDSVAPYYTVKTGSDVVEKQYIDCMHILKQLRDDMPGTTKYTSYSAGAGATPTANAQHVWVELPIAHFSANRPILALALPEELQLEFTIPSVTRCVIKDPSPAGATTDNVADTYAASITSAWLRVHYVESAQPNRELSVRQHLAMRKEHPILTQEYVHVAGTAITGSNGTGEDYLQAELDGIVQPSAQLLAVVRHEKDLEEAEVTTIGDFTSLVQANAELANPSPDRFRFYPWTYMTLYENNSRFYPAMAFDYFNHSLLPELYACNPYNCIGVISNSLTPRDDQRVAGGHITLSSLNKPNLRVGVRQAAYIGADPNEVFLLRDWYSGSFPGFNPDELDSAVNLTLTVYSLGRNFLVEDNARMYIMFA